jgi:hypothetical protein
MLILSTILLVDYLILGRSRSKVLKRHEPTRDARRKHSADTFFRNGKLPVFADFAAKVASKIGV